jgi:phage tail sheath protein FI
MPGLSPEIIVREEAPKTRLIEGEAQSTLLALGVTERGPQAATLVTSFEEFLNIFGSDNANSDLVPAVRGFFDEGGQQAVIKRVVHYTNIESAGTRQGAAGTITLQSAVGAPGAGSITGTIAGPWALIDTDTLIVNPDAGGNQTATFNAAAGVVTGTNTETFVLSDGMTLIFTVDGGSAQTVTFNTAEFTAIAAATAAEVAAVINAEATGMQASVSAGAVRITSDTKGTGSNITVTGGTSATVLGLSGANNTGTGDAANSAAVTAAEMKTWIEGDVTGVTVSEATGGYLTITSNTVGASSSIQIDATSTADDELGFDNATHSGDSGAAADALKLDGKTHGSYTNTIKHRVLNATSGDSTEFNIQVEDNGVVVEGPYENLTMASLTAERYAPTIINASSNLVAGSAPGTMLYKRPANGLSAVMTGGDDGLTGLATTDYIGSATTSSGLRGFDEYEDGRILICPGQTASAVQAAIITYCESTRNGSIFAVLDPPTGQTAAQMVTFAKTTNGLYNLSEFGSLFWPPIKVLNPSADVYGSGDTITVYPSGHIAGVFARNDIARPGGIYQASAGVDYGKFRTVVGLETDATKDKGKRGLLYPARINPIQVQGGKIIIGGVRTLRGNLNFPSISERRGVIFIEQSLRVGLQFAQFKNNDAELRAEVRRAIVAFLTQQMYVGAFRSKVPSDAFTVDVSDALNPPSAVFAGKLTAKVGLATAKPAEFITLIFSQDTRALDEELALTSA